jgi:hypothetical protein
MWIIETHNYTVWENAEDFMLKQVVQILTVVPYLVKSFLRKLNAL